MSHYLIEWAEKWGIPNAAFAELAQLTSDTAFTPDPDKVGRSEEAIQNARRVHAAQGGAWLMRNNVGALKDHTGRVLRFGLCNETKDVNKRLKSSDLIGIEPVRITPAHVGQVIGQFVAIECKEYDWKWSGNAHEMAQLAFGCRVRSLGGKFHFESGGVKLCL